VTSRRLNHLDALRAAAMLVVVVWHVTLNWPGYLTLQGSTIEVLEWALAATRWSLALFFLMAGFFGAQLLRRWGTARFTRDRLRRIGIPLAVGIIAIVPLAEPILHAVRPELGAPEVPAHLWFLWYVLLLYGVAGLLLRAPWIDRVSAATARLVASPVAVPVLAAVTAALLLGGRFFSVGDALWLVPKPELMAFYGSFFVVGVLLHRTPEGVDAGGRRPWLTGAIAMATLVPLVLLDPRSVWEGNALLSAERSWGWLVLLCVFTWAAVFCLCGVGKRLLAAERPAVRYIADSSYWIFLMHLPLVPLAITVAISLGQPFPVAWAVGMALLFSFLLITYELFVRHTFIGRILNGPRPPRRWGLSRASRETGEPRPAHGVQ
jgi:glucans biosynthesis protein C